VTSGESLIHETAIVDEGAVIGPGTTIWHHCHVRDGAVIGSLSRIGKNVYVDAGAQIGDRCKVQNNVSIYRGVTLEDDVFVGPSAVFTNDLNPRAASSDWEVTPTLVRQGASIGANATIVCGIVVGAWAFVGAGAVVTREVLDHEVVAGNPAKRIGWACECGHVVSHSHDDLVPQVCPLCGRDVPRSRKI
jgi:acetyltransferase-like isoleucine patch superfamily enzyme